MKRVLPGILNVGQDSNRGLVNIMSSIIIVVAFLLVSGVVFLLAEQLRQSFRSPVRRRLTPRPVPGQPAGSHPLVDSLAVQLPQRRDGQGRAGDGTYDGQVISDLRPSVCFWHSVTGP